MPYALTEESSIISIWGGAGLSILETHLQAFALIGRSYVMPMQRDKNTDAGTQTPWQ